jgi:hypothetical protein
MKQLLAVLLYVSIPLSIIASHNSYKVTYDGGSLSNLNVGTGIDLHIDQDKIRFVDKGNEIANFPATAVTEISYGQNAHRLLVDSHISGDLECATI